MSRENVERETCERGFGGWMVAARESAEIGRTGRSAEAMLAGRVLWGAVGLATLAGVVGPPDVRWVVRAGAELDRQASNLEP